MQGGRLSPSPPLPMRNGVAPSKVYLPNGPWLTLFEFLVERFRFMSVDVLRLRLERGDIVDAGGQPQGLDSPYVALQWLWYYREVPHELRVPFEMDVLYRDEHLVVADKPHFLASIPGGRYLQETALTRLRTMLDLPLLSPIHRLDRDTAGVMLFCVDPASRGAYQTLFQSRQVKKEYEAIALWSDDLALPQVYSSRLQPKDTHFTMREVQGQPNSQTRIRVLARWGRYALYGLEPHTGRKHQLRVHMSALGIPICNDFFYPELSAYQDDGDYSRPLQLLARAVEFTDPFSGQLRRFESRRTLVDAPASVTP